MKIEVALEEIEDIVRQLDPVQLYQPYLGRELQNIVRKVRKDLKEDDVRKALGTSTF